MLQSLMSSVSLCTLTVDLFSCELAFYVSVCEGERAWGGEREHTCVENSRLSFPSEHLRALNRECCSPKTYISLCCEAGAAHKSGPFSQGQVLSLKISRSSSSLAGGPDTGGQVSVLTWRVSPGLCALSVLAVVFVGGKGGRTCFILLPQKQVWEEKSVLVLFIRLQSVAGDSAGYLICKYVKLLGSFSTICIFS